MRWRKLGRVFTAEGQRPWMHSHTSMPFAEPMSDGRIRIWFTPRDQNNQSHLAWLEIDLDRPAEVLALAEAPTLAPGANGTFDDTGAMGSWLTDQDGERRHYYIGWTQSGAAPFHLSIGVARNRDGGTAFTRVDNNPVHDRNPHDPILVSTPCVIPADGHWAMYYLSATRWRPESAFPDYNIRRATSPDGFDWKPDTAPCIDFAEPWECALARPCVVRDKDRWRMWFCRRGDDHPYRIGYAESGDGITWARRDDRAGLTVSGDGWDSEMTAYPFVFDHAGGRYMLYAGNGYGSAGMGLAVLDQD